MKIDTDTLTVLSTALAVDGVNVRIIEQLDRKRYTKVNAVLEALGGTWNRKAKAHVFLAADADPADAIEGVLATGDVTVAKVDLAFFPTPASLAAELVALAGVKPGDRVLEPSAGTGRIVDAILATGAMPVWCERDDKMRSELDRLLGERGQPYRMNTRDDFLNVTVLSLGAADACVMNPPFKRIGLGDHLNHVRHAHRFIEPGGTLVSVLPSSVTFRQDARHREFRHWVELHGGELRPLPDDSFKASGTSVRTVVLRMRVP